MEISRGLQERMNKISYELQDIIEEIQSEELLNTQEALDFIDKINELSVTF